MPIIQILLTAASLSAAAGGAWGFDRVMERYGRIPEAAAEATVDRKEDAEDYDPRLIY